MNEVPRAGTGLQVIQRKRLWSGSLGGEKSFGNVNFKVLVEAIP